MSHPHPGGGRSHGGALSPWVPFPGGGGGEAVFMAYVFTPSPLWVPPIPSGASIPLGTPSGAHPPLPPPQKAPFWVGKHHFGVGVDQPLTPPPPPFLHRGSALSTRRRTKCCSTKPELGPPPTTTAAPPPQITAFGATMQNWSFSHPINGGFQPHVGVGRDMVRLFGIMGGGFSAAPPPALLLSHCSQYSGTAGMGQHRFSVGGRMVTTGGGGPLCGDGDQRGKTPFSPSIAPKCHFRGERNPPPPSIPLPRCVGGVWGPFVPCGAEQYVGKGSEG